MSRPSESKNTIASRFWEKVEKRGPQECWNWTAAKNEKGYGVIRPDGRRSGPGIKAHRLSAELAGMDVGGKTVLHSCDNPLCVNPSHLRVGSMQDNADDMVLRNRVAYGVRRPQAKLNDEIVLEMRRRHAAGETYAALASEFNVSQSSASRAVNGKTWIRAKDAVVPLVARDVINAIRDAA